MQNISLMIEYKPSKRRTQQMTSNTATDLMAVVVVGVATGDNERPVSLISYQSQTTSTSK
jgi:hypothetical protein